jgi:hypothetical protein
MLDHRGRQLRVALSLLELGPAPADAALAALRSWLDSWTGIGAVTDGMRTKDDLQLTRYDARGWRAITPAHPGIETGETPLSEASVRVGC